MYTLYIIAPEFPKFCIISLAMRKNGEEGEKNIPKKKKTYIQYYRPIIALYYQNVLKSLTLHFPDRNFLYFCIFFLKFY